MILNVYFGVSGLSDLGYRFYNSDESTNGSRITAGIVDAGNGWYSVQATVPDNAVSVRWDSTGNASLVAREYFFNLIYPGTSWGQLDMDAGRVKVSPGTSAGQIDLTSGRVKLVAGSLEASTFNPGAINASAIAAGAFTSSAFAVGAFTSNIFAAGAITKLALAADTGLVPSRTGTAQGGGSNFLTLDASASSVNNFYNTGILFLVGGTGAGQYGIILDYDGVSKNATMTDLWAVTPDATTQFAILPLGSISASAPTAEEIANEVLAQIRAAGNASQANFVSDSIGQQKHEQVPGGLNLSGVVGNDLVMDVYFQDIDLTGYSFNAYVVIEPLPLEKKFTLTVTPVDLANGQISVSLTDAQTAAIGPVSGKSWFIKWDGGATGITRNLLMGRFMLNRY